MKLDDQRIRVRIKTQRDGKSHAFTAVIKFTATDEQFWRIVKAHNPDDPASSLAAIQEALLQEKQGVLGQTIGKERENNPSNIWKEKAGIIQGRDGQPSATITETGETYDVEHTPKETGKED